MIHQILPEQFKATAEKVRLWPLIVKQETKVPGLTYLTGTLPPSFLDQQNKSISTGHATRPLSRYG
jgi:hypothetical protein